METELHDIPKTNYVLHISHTRLGQVLNEFAKKVLDFLNDSDVVQASVHQDIKRIT